MFRRSLLIAAAVLAAAAPPAGAADYAPGEVVVRTATATGEPRTRIVRTGPGETVTERAAALRRRPGVLSANPNYIARVSYVPNDPGIAGVPGGWQDLQWNFSGPFGIGVPAAWDNVGRAGNNGGEGVVVAVLDTGVAYSDDGQFGRSPDLRGNRFVRGYDFVDDDPYPFDEHGHGTHVASTIAESIDNGVGVTGIAYGVKLMPVRIIDRRGEGTTADIAKGIRYAVRNGADIINLSITLDLGLRARDIPAIIDALAEANRKGVLVVAAAGNQARPKIGYPARARGVLAVGATTERGCRADYSVTGNAIDVVAPGGGSDATLDGDPNCRPTDPPGRDIVQMTFDRKTRAFSLQGDSGTSMAAAHVSGTAALVLGARVLGRPPTPRALERHLEQTARDLGIPGPDNEYGSGLIDAAAATAPLKRKG